MVLRLRIRELVAEKAAQENRKITANSLAEVIGVSPNTIRAYMENKALRPDLRILQKLQDYFECSIEDLFENVEGDDLEWDDL